MPSAGDNLSLGKLGRAALGESDYESETSLNDCGRDSGTAETSMSDFDAGAVGTMTLNPDTANSGTTTGTINFTSPGSLFISRIAGRFANFTWSETNDSYNVISISSNQDYTATITITSGNPFADGDTMNVIGKYHDAGQSDGFNDHVTNYNTNRSDIFTYDDAV